jgi:hypothetical protein
MESPPGERVPLVGLEPIRSAEYDQLIAGDSGRSMDSGHDAVAAPGSGGRSFG